MFDEDIEKPSSEEDLLALEDSDARQDIQGDAGNFVFPSPLYKLALDYSGESLYATALWQPATLLPCRPATEKIWQRCSES